MSTLSHFASILKDDLLRNISNPPKVHFFWNARGFWERVVMAPLIIKNGETLKRSVEKMKIHYGSQNPRGQSTEAQMVRSKVWKAEDVGWLWTVYNDKRIWLAKVSPVETKDLAPGWFTEKGDLVLDGMVFM